MSPISLSVRFSGWFCAYVTHNEPEIRLAAVRRYWPGRSLTSLTDATAIRSRSPVGEASTS